MGKAKFVRAKFEFKVLRIRFEELVVDQNVSQYAVFIDFGVFSRDPMKTSPTDEALLRLKPWIRIPVSL